MATPPRILTGQCLCGAIHYEVADEFRYAMNCHCSQCRRATGSAFKPFAGIEAAKLRITEGEGNIAIYGDPSQAHDVHCKTCFSLLYSIVNEGTTAHVALGTLMDTPSIRPTSTSSWARRRPGTRSRTTCRKRLSFEGIVLTLAPRRRRFDPAISLRRHKMRGFG
jgi:hypothetical protein